MNKIKELNGKNVKVVITVNPIIRIMGYSETIEVFKKVRNLNFFNAYDYLKIFPKNTWHLILNMI